MAMPESRAVAVDGNLAALQARAARGGWRLARSSASNGRLQFVLTRWGRAIDCADLDEVRAVLARVGAAA